MDLNPMNAHNDLVLTTNSLKISDSVFELTKSLPHDVQLVAAAKTRIPEEVRSAIQAGVKIIGYNYVQEAVKVYKIIGNIVKWHLIGHLQHNKVKKAVKLFDMIETIDSWNVAETVDIHCAAINKIMPVLIEVNSGREINKTGVLPEEVTEIVWEISDLPNLSVQGLMTMGPRFGNPEDARPYFRATKVAFDILKQAQIKNVEMRYLSMGMSNSYQIAIEEGANIIRIGTKLFGER